MVLWVLPLLASCPKCETTLGLHLLVPPESGHNISCRSWTSGWWLAVNLDNAFACYPSLYDLITHGDCIRFVKLQHLHSEQCMHGSEVSAPASTKEASSIGPLSTRKLWRATLELKPARNKDLSHRSCPCCQVIPEWTSRMPTGRGCQSQPAVRSRMVRSRPLIW